MIALPVDDILPDLIAALRQHRAVVLVAPPGSGKTTRVPPAVLDAGLAGDGRVVVLQPRRVAARLSARRIAAERGSVIGEEVGWRVRFENRTSARTRIEVVTEGMLTRQAQLDPFLEGVGVVILDEFHERSLHADLALSLVAQIRREARDDLSVVVMSATLDPGPVAAFLDCPVIETAGRTYPVTLRYDERTEARDPVDRMGPAIRRALADASGHVLAFLPGAGEIRRVERGLGDLPKQGVAVAPLHGGLEAAAQDRALAPSKQRKVVLATNIAETSVTLEGVGAVVDAGLVRQPRFETALGLDRLETISVSRASADQRAGRAGRTARGLAVRLWTAATHQRLIAATAPELQRADLTRTVLEVFAWGGAADFPWFERPPADSLDHALRLLALLGATDGQRITSLGEALLALPLHPRLGAVVLAGHRAGRVDEAAWMAALASERDPFWRVSGLGGDDLTWRLDCLRGARSLPLDTDRAAAAAVRRSARQIMGVARRALGRANHNAGGDPTRLLLAGFPDRVARRRGPRSRRLKLVGGRGAEQHRTSAELDAELVVAVEMSLRERGTDPEVRIAAAVDRSWLRTETEVIQRFDPTLQRVVARRVTRYQDLVLSEENARGPLDKAQTARLLAEAAAADPEAALGSTPALDALRARVALLRAHLPDLALSAPPDNAALLAVLCQGRRSFEALRQADAAGAAHGALDWATRSALDTYAPEHVKVPSGAQIPVDYTSDPPVIAARIQQLFGMTHAPRLARGRVQCRVQLLAPNNRPVQVTDDLESFWTNTYPQIRRELRGRYPRHAWPEHPTAADAANRPRRRRRK